MARRAATTSSGSGAPERRRFLVPLGVAIDASTGKLYITLLDAVMVAVLPN